MGIGINTNMASIISQTNLAKTSSSYESASQRLSSGLRVNSAKDDAAGLAIASRMDSQVRGMQVAQRNASDAISMAQTAEGALASVSENLQRMRELAVQAKNPTNGISDRANMDTELKQLQGEIERVIIGTTFNDKGILYMGATQEFQVGAGNATADTIQVTTTDMLMHIDMVTVRHALDTNVLTDASADFALTNIDNALALVNTERAVYGAIQSRFESAINNLGTSIQNQSAAKGRIMDADYAKETLALSKANVLQQAGMAMLSQANQQPNNVLSLLR
jgi:flagellin